MAAALFQDGPSPMTYNSEVDPKVAQEDEAIVGLQVDPTAVEIVPVTKMFE